MTEEQFISVKQASEILGCTMPKVYSLINKGIVESSYRQFEGKRGMKLVLLKDVEIVAAEEKEKKKFRQKAKELLSKDIQELNQKI